jgi:hypothetical protein
MDYNDEEYLNLFKKIKEDQQPSIIQNYTFEQIKNNTTLNNNFRVSRFQQEYELLKETPNYDSFKNFNQSNINEVQRNNYSQDLNLNEFNIETRIDGQNINEIKKHQKEERLNEVMEHLRQERLNEIKKTQEEQSLNENINFRDTDIVTLEMFEKARFNSMMIVAKRILPK